MQSCMLLWERAIAKSLSEVVGSWAKPCFWASASLLSCSCPRITPQDLLGQNPHLLKALSQVQDGVVGNIVCLSLTSVLRMFISGEEDSNSS